MCFASLLWASLAEEYFDVNGVKFNNVNRTRLILAPEELSEYEIPKETEIISGGILKEYSAFASCKDNLKKLKFQIGSKLKTIEQYGLYGLSQITELDMSMCTELTEITNAALSNCKALVTFIFPPNLKSVTVAGMQTLPKLTRLDFPSSFTTIGGYSSLGAAMSGCSSVTIITWGETPSIQSIGQLGLASCKIKSLHIPLSLKYIGQESLSGAPLEEFIVDQGHDTFLAEGMWLYNTNKTKLVLVSQKQGGNITIPESVEIVGPGAILGCPIESVSFGSKVRSLESDSLMYAHIIEITIPSTVTYLGVRTLNGCTHLSRLELLANITTIPDSFLASCNKLEKIVLPSGIRSISSRAFAGCSNVDYIFIPNTVDSISYAVFNGINKSVIIDFEANSSLCYENGYIYSSDFSTLTSCIIFDISFEAIIKSSVTKISNMCFNELDVTSVIFEGTSNLHTIEESAFSNTKINRLVLPSSMRYIKKNAFLGCPLKTITFNEGLLEINEKAFVGTQISKVIFSDSVQLIGQSAFENINSLNTIVFGANLQTIGIKAFAGTKIKLVEIPPMAENIGDSAFANSELSTLFFASPSLIQSVSKFAFKDCIHLTDVSFAPEIKEIGEGCFTGCIQLKGIEIGEGIINISSQAFKDCSLLAIVKIPDTSNLRNIGSLAFDGCKNLKEFDVSDTNPSFSTEDGVLFDRQRTKIIVYLSANERKNFTVPETVTEISIFSFQDAVNLNWIHIKGNITKIGYGAFNGCSNLYYVNIPSSLTEIGASAFNGCDNLHCGSIIHESSQRDWLVEHGVPIEGLTPCKTAIFSLEMRNKDASIFSLISSTLIHEDESNPGSKQSYIYFYFIYTFFQTNIVTNKSSCDKKFLF